jgi:hypothetical protein
MRLMPRNPVNRKPGRVNDAGLPRVRETVEKALDRSSESIENTGMISGRAKFLLGIVCIVGAGAIYLTSVKDMHRTSDELAGKTSKGPGSAGAQGAKPADSIKKPAAPPRKPQDIPDDIAPGQASQLLQDFFKKTPNMEERKAFASELIRKLCKAGYSAEAWDVIPDELSTTRSAMLRDYFAHAELPPGDLLAKIGQMDSDVSDVFKGYLSRFSPQDLSAMLASPDMRTLMEQMGPEGVGQLQISRNTGDLLKKKLGKDPVANAEVIDLAGKLRTDGLLSSSYYAELVNDDRTQDAFQKWEKVEAIDPGKGKERQAILDTKREIIQGMSQKNPTGTMDQLLRSSQADKVRNLGVAVSSWLHSSPKNATEWYDRNVTTLNPEDRGLIMEVYSNEMIESGDIERAKVWIGKISDPADKERAYGKLAKVVEMQRLYEETHKKNEVGQ